MTHKIHSVASTELRLITEGERVLVFPLQDGQRLPSEFKVGDEAHVQNHPDILARVGIYEMAEENVGYYVVTHMPSGATVRIAHNLPIERYRPEE